MAVVIGEAAVKLRPEASKFGDEAEREVDDKLPGVAKKAAGFFAAAFAAVGVGAFLKNAVSEAVDLGENMSKVEVVFGDSAGAVNDFAATASTALGQSRNQALAAAGTFGSLFVGMGIGQTQAKDMSLSMVQLASDMASFSNATPEEALDALRAGLIGETEPLRRFGVMLDAAKVEAEAMRLGLVGVGGELTEAAKAQAVYSLVMQQTSLQQGDFERTSAGLANQQRIIKAQFTDLTTNVGGLFVPALANAAAGITGGLMPALLGATERLPALGDALGAAGDVFRVGFDEGLDSVFEMIEGTEGLARWVGVIAGNAGDLSAIFRESFVDGAYGSVLLGETGLAGFAVTLGHLASQVRDALLPAFDAIGDAVGPALEQVAGAFGDAFGGGEGGGGIMGTVVSVLATIGPIIGDYISRWAEVFAAVIPIVADVLSALAPVVADLVGQIGPLLSSLLPVVSQVAGVFATTLLTVIQALAPAIPPLVTAIGQIAGVLAGAFLSVIEALAPVLPVLAQAIGDVAGAIAGALGQAIAALAPVLPPLVAAISQVAVAIAGALGQALEALLPVIPPIIDVLLQLVVAVLRPLLPIIPTLAGLLGGLIAAFAPLLPAVARIVSVLLDLVIRAVTPLLPLLPILSDLLLTIIGAIEPLIPIVVNLVTVLIDVALQALMPLLPLLTMTAEMFVALIPVLLPIIELVLRVAAVWIQFQANISAAVLGFVADVIGSLGGLIDWFVSLPGRILGAIGSFGTLLFSKGVELIQGLVNGIASAASFVGDIARNVVNAIIGFINDKVIGGINDLLEFKIAIPGAPDIRINPPDIPRIPRLHSGGVFTTDDGSGEGLALLRDDELVATPEQRRVADNLLRSLLDGDLGAPAAAAAAAGAGVNVVNNITQQPGESGEALAAQVTQRVVWNLNAGITRPAPVGGGS